MGSQDRETYGLETKEFDTRIDFFSRLFCEQLYTSTSNSIHALTPSPENNEKYDE